MLGKNLEAKRGRAHKRVSEYAITGPQRGPFSQKSGAQNGGPKGRNIRALSGARVIIDTGPC